SNRRSGETSHAGPPRRPDGQLPRARRRWSARTWWARCEGARYTTRTANRAAAGDTSARPSTHPAEEPSVTPLLLLAATLPAPAARAPTPAQVRQAVERSLPFLLKSSEVWRDNRKCVTCHQVPFALWPLNEARARGLAVDAKRLDDLTAWSLEFCTTN